ncbi:DUF3955 domain-containing protein [Chelativorans sp.]|uniref:DUF3955 domain-containing protein n=1 Tax=Chelativorans sp. TaxID=2203393 RepID=UPI0028126388|nr:DUF3955 domain-containing protein [Chelativorans sp.]
MNMNRLHWVFLIALPMGIGCLLAFGLIGARIGEQNILHEPFFLAAMGWLLLLISLICLVAGFMRKG